MPPSNGASIKSVKGKFGEALEFGNQNGHFVDTGLQITSKQYEELTMMAWAKPYTSDMWLGDPS